MNTVTVSKIMKMIHRTANNLSDHRKDHGIRVAYLVYRALLHSSPLASESVQAILRTVFFHEISAHEPQNNAVLAYMLARDYSPYPEHAPLLLNHQAESPCFRFIHHSQRYLAQLFSIADQLDELMQSGIWNGYDLFSRFDLQRDTVYEASAINAFFENGIHFLAEEFRNDDAFLALLFGREPEPDIADAYLSSLVAALDFQSEKTAARRAVRTAFCEFMASLLDFPDSTCQALLNASMLCDIGAYGLSPALHEYGNRSRAKENELLQDHVQAGARILDGLIPDCVLQLVTCHHERPNGTGYPRGLTDSQLSGEAQILSLADDMSELYCGTAANPERSLRISLPRQSSSGGADADFAHRVVPHIGEMVLRADRMSEQILEQYRDLSFSVAALQTKIYRYHQKKPVSQLLVSEKSSVSIKPLGQDELLLKQTRRRQSPSFLRTSYGFQ